MRAAVLLTAVLACFAQTPPRPNSVQAACTLETLSELGLDCSPEEPCPIFLELSSVEAVGDRLILAGNLHTGTATLESILLVSDDGGKTWAEAHARLPNAVLDRVQFQGFETGWINGHVLHPLPRDPFFLITSDGGKTWRKRPLSGETRAGAIEQYWFDSRTHGLLVMQNPQSAPGQRYELWESNTSGDSWNILQVGGEPAKLPVAAEAVPYRIRADAAAKAHRIERQAGGKWETVAAFRVAAGECKPARPALAEPVPEPDDRTEPKPAAPPKKGRRER